MKRSGLHLLGQLLLAAALIACSSGEPGDGDGDGPDGSYELSQPGLDQIAPNAVALGDQVAIFGADYVPPEYGSVHLELSGTYHDEMGESHDYTGRLPLEFVNPSVAELDFNQLFFLGSQDRIGTFRGEARVVNRLHNPGDDASTPELASEVLDVSIQVKPSIVIKRLRSIDGVGCADFTKGTNPNHNLELIVDAIGLGSASPEAPWTMSLSFTAPSLAVRYLKEGNYDFWPPNGGEVDADLVANAPKGNNKFTMRLTEGSDWNLNPQAYPTTVRVNPPVDIGQEVHDTVIIERFAAGPLEGMGIEYAPMIAEVTTYDGTTIQRLVDFEIRSEYELSEYDGEVKLLERFQAQQVSGCFSGGDIGRDLSYSEGESESRSRSLSYRWDRNVASTLGLNINPGGFNAWVMANASETLSETFGVDVNQTLSSEVHTSLNLTAHILPTYNGVCYRQTEKLEREVDVVYHNACGATGVIGQAALLDWTWGFDIATGPECPPPSNLPEPTN